MILAIALALFAQTPAAVSPRIEDVNDQRIFDEAQRALSDVEGLLGLHRGFRKYLAADDELRQAEEAYDAAMELSRLRNVVGDFEEILIVDSAARTDFVRYTARLGRDPVLRTAADALSAIQTEKRVGGPELAQSYAYLATHPYTAISVLMQTPPQRILQQELRPLRDAFIRDRLLQTRLRDAWIALDAQAGAREAVYPWWERAYGGSTAAAQRYRALEAEFSALPSQRRAWETREIAWGAHPGAIEWRDHLYARVRRNPDLESIYFAYLRILRTHPNVEQFAEDSFAAKRGAPPAWPPQGKPPALSAWERPEPIAQPSKPQNPNAPALNAPQANRPQSPTVQRPTAPTRPVSPERTPTLTAPNEPPL